MSNAIVATVSGSAAMRGVHVAVREIDDEIARGNVDMEGAAKLHDTWRAARQLITTSGIGEQVYANGAQSRGAMEALELLGRDLKLAAGRNGRDVKPDAAEVARHLGSAKHHVDAFDSQRWALDALAEWIPPANGNTEHRMAELVEKGYRYA